MNIGLIHVDGKYPNLALMKISAWHKAKGDEVEFYYPLNDAKYNDVYASKVFSSTPDDPYIPEYAERGGWGYNNCELPDFIEHIYPDYDLYRCDYAMGFTTRGCPRRCPWCIVPEKEGNIKVVADIYEFWNGQSRIRLLDANLTAKSEHFEKICKQIVKEKVAVDFCQGLDIRYITREKASMLAKVKTWKRIHFAWDEPDIEDMVDWGIKTLVVNGVSRHNLMFYVLIGFDTTPEEDYYRVMKLREWGVDPFVMPYNREDRYQRDFARWVNHKAIFKSVGWGEYERNCVECEGGMLR